MKKVLLDLKEVKNYLNSLSDQTKFYFSEKSTVY